MYGRGFHKGVSLNATVTFVVFGLPTLGALLGGILGQSIGLPETLVIAAIGEILACVWIVFRR
jgi:predicted MFS family arabinose efflux permease